MFLNLALLFSEIFREIIIDISITKRFGGYQLCYLTVHCNTNSSTIENGIAIYPETFYEQRFKEMGVQFVGIQ